MEVICIEEKAFFELMDRVYEYFKAKQGIEHEKWIDGSEAMALLGIKSKTTLQKLRDQGDIRFTQPQKKIILYDRDSIEAYLNKHAKDRF